jgi:hypothetical protein
MDLAPSKAIETKAEEIHLTIVHPYFTFKQNSYPLHLLMFLGDTFSRHRFRFFHEMQEISLPPTPYNFEMSPCCYYLL